MIIRTITCHHSFNHGAMLQTFALLNYLQSQGHDARVIDYSPGYMPTLNISLKWVPKEYDHWGIKQLYRRLKLRARQQEQQRRNALERFYNQYIDVTENHYAKIDDLRNDPPLADVYIAGSDQIWNTTFNNGLDPAFYLDFGNPKRRVSYAASFATTALRDGTEQSVKERLAKFDAISVRENSGLQILEQLGLSGCVVVDPVFLLSEEQWDRFDNAAFAGEKYILIYDFEKKGQTIAPLAKRLARLHDFKIYSVGPFKYRYSDKNFVDVGPDVFVSLIKHAQCVISNSFHGTAFSMIYKKDFFVVNRQDGLNIRMQDLLARYGLIDRLVDAGISSEDLIKSIDYTMADMKISRDIEFSKSFLQRQLELVK